MKLGVSAYSFARYYYDGRMDDLRFPAKAKEMGFEAIEYAGLNVPEGENLKDWAHKVREACDAAGFEVSNYTIGGDFISGSGGDLAAEITRLKGEVDIAAILGAKGMRHDATYGVPADVRGARDFATFLPRVAEGCRAVTEYAAGKGIKTMVENHGRFCQDSSRVEALISAVNHPNFGWLVDMGNFFGVDEDPGHALGIAMQYAFHVHAKDMHIKDGNGPNPGEGWGLTRGGNYNRGAIIGHGSLPITRCLRLMKAAGYDGVFSIEFEGMEDNETGLRIGLANLRSYVKEIYG